MNLRILGVADTSGNAIATAYQHAFTTKAALDFASPTYVTNANWPQGVPRDVTVKIIFSEPIDPASVNANTVYFQTLADVNHPTSPTLNASQRTVLVSPASPLAANTAYRVVLDGVTDLHGNRATEVAQGIGGVETGVDLTDAGPPTVTAFQPADGATNVPINTVVNVVFSEPFDPFSYTGDLFEVRDPNGTVIAARRVGDPPNDLLASTTYTIHTKPARDFAGNLLVEHVGTFTTSAGTIDTTPPQVLSQNPLNNQRDVPTDIVITIDFDEPVLATDLLFRQSTPFMNLEAAVAVSPDGTRLTVQPSAPLVPGSWYQLYVMISDAVGNRLITPGTGGFFAFSFQVAAGSLTEELEADRLRVLHVNPPNGAANVGGGAVTLTLSEPLDPAALEQVFLGLDGERASEAALTLDGRTLEFGIPIGRTAAEATILFSVDGATPFESGFEYAGPGAPNLAWTRPPMGAVGVAPEARMYFGFSEPLDPMSISAAVEALADGAVVTGAVELIDEGRVLVFQPDLAFHPGAAVRALADQSMLRTADGRTIAEWPFELRFEAGPAFEDPSLGPAIADAVVWPPAGAKVPTNGLVVVAWQGDTASASRLGLRRATGEPAPVRITVRAQEGRAVAVVTPHQPLEAGAEYVVVVAAPDGAETELSRLMVETGP